MKSIILTESEKKSILENYTSNSKNNNLLKEELSRIGNMMGVKTNFNIVTEGAELISKGIFKFPIFKAYQKYLRTIDEDIAKELEQKDISEFSQRLRDDGINNSNVYDNARKFWQEASGKGETGLKGYEENDLVNWFLITKYADELADINTNILRDLERKQNTEIQNILNIIKGDNSTTVRTNVFDELGNPLTSVNKSEVDEMLLKIANSEKQCDKALAEIKSQADVARTRKDAGTVKLLNDQSEQWQFLKKELQKQKEMYTGWKTSLDLIYNTTPKTKIIHLGREYDMTGLSPLQRFIYANAITKQFQFLLTIARMAEISQIGSRLGVLEQSIAGLRNALGQPPNTVDFKAIDAYTQQVISTMKAFTGRPIKEGTTISWLEATINPYSKKVRTDFAEEWNRFLGILNASDLTDVEKEQIKKTLMEKFSKPNVGKGWEFTVLYDDIKTILGRMGADDDGKVLETEFQKSLKGKPYWEKQALKAKNFLKEILGELGSYVKTIIQTFIRFAFTGLLTGMRTAVAPLLKFGVNPKGLMRTFVRLWLIKTSFSVAVATIIFGVKEIIFGLGEVLGLFNPTNLGTEEWQNQTWNSYVKDLEDAVLSFPWTDFSFGETGETGEIPILRRREYQKYKFSEGIFRQYAVEWTMEAISAYRNTDSSEDQNALNQEIFSDWQQAAGTKWVDNAIKKAGPEGVEKFVNEKTSLPTSQDAIMNMNEILKKVLTDSEREKIANHYYFKFKYTTEEPEGFGGLKSLPQDKTKNRFENFTPSMDSLAGQTRICKTEPIPQKDGTKKCTGGSWRADVFTDVPGNSTLANDEYLKEYLKLGRQENGSGPLWEKARSLVNNSNIYFTNQEEGNKINPSVGKNMVNVEPISNILNKLK